MSVSGRSEKQTLVLFRNPFSDKLGKPRITWSDIPVLIRTQICNAGFNNTCWSNKGKFIFEDTMEKA